MSISETYNELLLNEVIQEILEEGIPLTIEEITSRFLELTGGLDTSQPLFNIDNALVDFRENASASKFNNTHLEVRRDLIVLYRELFLLTDRSVKEFQRWRIEAKLLEAELRSIKTRVDNLLNSLDDRNAYYIHDTFDDVSKTDLPRTSLFVDVKAGHVRLYPTDQDRISRVDLNDISAEDLTFTVLSRSNLLSVNTPISAELKNAVDDTTSYWQTRVYVNSSQLPVTAELKIKIANSPIPVSRITYILHNAGSVSSLQVTPLLSDDGVVYYSIPEVTNPSIVVEETGNWTFETQEITHVKFVFTKLGYDFAEETSFIYEFGAKEISFFDESFTNSNKQVFESKTLSVLDLAKNIVEFDSIELDTCEVVPAGTQIDYFVWGSNDITVSGGWIQLDPKSRTNKNYPSITSLGSTVAAEFDSLMISYAPTLSGVDLSPDKSYYTIHFNGTSAYTTAVTLSDARYHLINSNDRLLNYQIDGEVNVIPNSIELFRNIGERGNTDLVRGYQRGWRFEEPYYISIIEVKNKESLIIDFGDQKIILDEVELVGKVTITKGIHSIKVHKNNWLNIEAGLTIGTLKTTDSLFPYNHKLLIEGYDLIDTLNPYVGADIFASHYPKLISVGDFITNIEKDDYNKFAIDYDAPDESIDKNADIVFMVKSDENMSDFLDEVFLLRFSINSSLHKYFRVKAHFATEVEGVSPILESYSIRISK